ncbi:MAG: hypothetical protein WC455_22585 [Dehalococcoidia bacterium]|jgi:hypothetical protein
MIARKFKLKMGGKTVGHMRVKDGEVEVLKSVPGPANGDPLCWEKTHAPICDHSERGMGISFAWDSIHPFVCYDRNNKSVYAGDVVKWWEPGYEHDSLTGTVKWDKSHLRWGLCSSSNTMYPLFPNDAEFILDLIEEKP